jgi:hypothetical protein
MRWLLGCCLVGAGVVLAARPHHVPRRPAPGYQRQDFIQCLQAPYPWATVLERVTAALKAGVPAERIVVAAGWDRTLWAAQPGGGGALRGGAELVDALKAVREAGVPRVLVTLAGPAAMLRIQAQIDQAGLGGVFGLGEVPDRREGTKYSDPGQLPRYASDLNAEVRYCIAENIVSSEGGADKAGCLEAYLQVRDLHPKLLLFLDAEASALWALREAYASGHPECQFIGVHVPQWEDPRQAALLRVIQDPEGASQPLPDSEELEKALRIRAAMRIDKTQQ